METELRELIIKVLKDSGNTFSAVEIFNYLMMENLIPPSFKHDLEIRDIRKICKSLVYEGILIEKEHQKYAYALKIEKTETIIESEPKNPHTIEKTSFHSKNNIYNKLEEIRFFDLKLCIILIICSIFFILIPPFDQTFIRFLIALPFLLFLPGYLLISLMFPKRVELSTIERFTLSIGLSIAIVVFDGFALNYTPWGFRPNSIVISLSLIMGIFLAATYFKRKKLGSEAYEFSFQDIESFYFTVKSKDVETGPEYDPALEKTLIRTMIIAILLVSAVVIYANVTRVPEKFTAFYILGSSEKAENYPEEVYINSPASLLSGIENFEYQPVNYTIRVQLGGQILKELPIKLKDKEKWLENVTFTPRMTSSIALAENGTKSKLELILLKDNFTYREVHLWVKPIFDINDFTPAITIINGEMMKSQGWNFESSSEDITGNYTEKYWMSPPYSFEINFTAHNSTEYEELYQNITLEKESLTTYSYDINFTAKNFTEFGELYQNITVDKESLAIISFYVKDSYSNITSNISKQVLLDNNVVWEAGVGNKSWEKVQLPVFFSKDTRLSFRVYNRLPSYDTFQVWWDEVKIEPYTKPNKETLNKPLTRPVVLSNSQKLDFRIRGMPIRMSGNVSIEGSNFPGFYYNIDQNISYERLDLSFSNGSTIETGNATYVSSIHGDEITFSDSNYKIINKNDIGLLSKVLLKNTDKIINLSEAWNIDNGYSLYLNIISSKGDTAMLELRKGGRTIDSRLLGVGAIFEYKATLAKNTTTIIKTRIESITFNSVKVKETELYSDNPTIIKPGDSIGDFEVTNVSSSEITMKNSYPIEINDSTMILGSNIKFKVIDDMAFPYAISGEIHGIPQSTLPESSMKINGLNYPGFNYDFDTQLSTEELIMDFSDNDTVDAGNAIYKTTKHGNAIHFLGESYWLPYPKRITFVSSFSTLTKTMAMNESLILENGYYLRLKEREDGGMAIFIKRNMTDSQEKLIENLINNPNLSKYSTFFKDYNYEMFTTTFKGRTKSNILYNTGEEFEYWIEYDEGKEFLLISGKVEAIYNNNVTFIIKQYQAPREFMPGMTFGEFEIYSTNNDTIILKNIKPLKFESGKETPIMGGAIRIRTSAKEPIAYPIRGK